MIETVERAIADELIEVGWEDIERAARAAIKAMREPTKGGEAMTKAEIVIAIGHKFGTFGGGVGSEYNPVAEALKDRPLVFAAGVSVADVVDFVLTAAAEVGAKDKAMTNIVERLRMKATVTCGCITCLDAADEIERLRAEIESLKSKDRP